jgi:hypothetical protein
MKSSDSNMYFFSQRRISTAANLIIATMLTFLFVAPISLLYYLSSNTVGLRRAVASIGVLVSFTLVFTALTSAFTRAKRHEVTAASAAYVRHCAHHERSEWLTFDTGIVPFWLSSSAMCRESLGRPLR